ncbi:MAG: glycosyltransferase family 2 protein [Deltaproteobacteria bacterium]|nr:glycosyltransferase family 2 protein [Deltaproteobacteria bacterium]
MSTNPFVSVIIPAFNSGRFIRETLDSVLHQTYKRLEIIVVDDGSTDNTQQCVEGYHSSVRYFRKDNGGVGSARNAGLRAGSGDYIAFLDHDDLWLPEKLDIQLSIAARHPDSGLIACNGVQFEDDRIISETLIHGPLAERLGASAEGEITGNFYPEVVQGCMLSSPGQILIPRAVCERVGPMASIRDETSDWDYYLRIAALYPITLHRHSLVRWRYVLTGRSGPLSQREFVWALMHLRTLKRHRRLRIGGDQSLITSRLRSLARETSKSMYYYGRRNDPAVARSNLMKLFQIVPSGEVARSIVALWFRERKKRKSKRRAPTAP